MQLLFSEKTLRDIPKRGCEAHAWLFEKEEPKCDPLDANTLGCQTSRAVPFPQLNLKNASEYLRQYICINYKILTSQSKRRIDWPMRGPFLASPLPRLRKALGTRFLKQASLSLLFAKNILFHPKMKSLHSALLCERRPSQIFDEGNFLVLEILFIYLNVLNVT